MATLKQQNQKQLWNMVPYDKRLCKVDDTDIKNVSTYKMFPADININNNVNYYKSLKQFLSPHCIVPVIDYSWTTSPVTAREDVPYIILNEKRSWKNNTFSKFIYSLTISYEYYQNLKDIINNAADKCTPQVRIILKKLDDFYEQISKTTGDAFSKIVGQKNIDSAQNLAKKANQKISNNKNINKVKETISNESNGFFEKTQEITKNLQEQTNKIIDFLNKSDINIIDDIIFCNTISNLNGPTNMYRNLYLCLNTGFQYILPYFDNKMRSVNNTWAINDSNVNPILAYVDKTVGGFNNILGAAEMMLNISQEKQGFYFEQSKPYQFPNEGETFTIKFPLVNTNTWDDVIKNWQFVFLFLYQNQPTRNDIAIIDPPVLYEVEIPNVRYIPYAYISSLQIEYKGTRRNMKMPIMKNGKIKEIETIIPDAWDITINLTGLTSEPTNFNILNKNIVTTNKL